MYNDVARNKPNHSTEFSSLIVKPNSRKIDRIVCADYFLSYHISEKTIRKNGIFGSCDQEIDS